MTKIMRNGKWGELEPPKSLLTEKERDRYSLSRAILNAVDGTACFELEVSDELQRSMPRLSPARARAPVPNEARISLPLEMLSLPPNLWLERGAQEVATASKGGELRYTSRGGYIPFPFSKTFAARLGARILAGLRDDTLLPRGTGSHTAVWVPESPTADVTPSAMVFDSVKLQPKLLSITNSLSRKLLAQATPEIDALIRDDFSAVAGVEIDTKVLTGVGSNNEPMGILNAPNVNSVAAGTNGAAPDANHLISMELELGLDNTDVGRLGMITTAQARRKLRGAAQISGATGNPVWTNGQVLGEYPAMSSQVVPSNLTKGTSTTICSAAVFGNWEELLIGQWGSGLEVIFNPYTLAKRGDIEMTAYLLIDCGLRHPTSFCRLLDWVNT